MASPRIGVKGIKLPKIDVRAITRSIYKEIRDTGRDIAKEFKKTTSTWSGDKPTFKSDVKSRGDDVNLTTEPEGSTQGVKKWTWLNNGTDPHPITGSPRLTFLNSDPAAGGRAYIAKTKPGQLASSPGEPASGPFHQPEDVQHPGVKARKWTKTVLDKLKKSFGKALQGVLKRVLKRGR